MSCIAFLLHQQVADLNIAEVVSRGGLPRSAGEASCCFTMFNCTFAIQRLLNVGDSSEPLAGETLAYARALLGASLCVELFEHETRLIFQINRASNRCVVDVTAVESLTLAR